MSKDEAIRVGQCLWCIACGISDETFRKIKPWMKEIEEIAKKYTKEGEKE